MESTLGKLVDEQAERDAIHVAIAPVIAMCDLEPGDKVGFHADSKTHVLKADKGIGIVDPFLADTVREGDRFYLCLYPNTVTGMRHHWQHPHFDDIPPAASSDRVEAAKRWLEQFAARTTWQYSDLLRIGRECVAGDSAWVGDDSNQDEFNENKR